MYEQRHMHLDYGYIDVQKGIFGRPAYSIARRFRECLRLIVSH